MEVNCPICNTRMVLDAQGTTIYCPACAQKKALPVNEQLVSIFPEQPQPTFPEQPLPNDRTIRWSYTLNVGGANGSKGFLQRIFGAVLGSALLILAVGIVVLLWSGLACVFAGVLTLFTGLLVVNIFKNSFRKAPQGPEAVKVSPIPPGQLPPP